MTTTQLVAQPCMDIRIGSTLSGSTLTGGRSIVDLDLLVSDYSALWGAPGGSSGPIPVIGQPGVTIPGLNLPRNRQVTLTVQALHTDNLGVPSDQNLVDNTDNLNALFDNPAGTILEWVMPDASSRWLRVWQLTGTPTTVTARGIRRNAFLLQSAWPYWRAETISSGTVNGAGQPLSIGGTVTRIYDPTLVFSSNGTFTDNTSGLAVTVAGASAPVTVTRDLSTGRWSATEGGVPVPNKVTVTHPSWIWLTRGGTFTSTVSTTVSWRDQWV